MRQLLYHWRFANDVYYADYTSQGSGKGYTEQLTYDFSKTNWPQAGQPFSIFTSSYGTAGKVQGTGFESNAPSNNWDRKQISQPPLVAADQFVVINNLGSTPGVLPTPTIVETNSGWDFTFELLKGNLSFNKIFIWDLIYTGETTPEPITYEATQNRLQDPSKPYYDPTLIKETEPGQPDVIIAGDVDDITNIYRAFLEPCMALDIGATGPVLTATGFQVYTVTFTIPRFGITQSAPTVTTNFSPSKITRRRDVVATRTPSTTLGKYYENMAPNGFVQLAVGDTNYFQDPIHNQSLGISGDAAPFPQQYGVQVPHWSLKPNFYVLPGQTWDVKYTTMVDMYAFEDYIDAERVTRELSGINNRVQIGSYWTFAEVFLSYYLFEGANAMICHQLLKLGITINPDSVNWYKQQILEMEGLDPKTYEVYLDLQREWREKQKRLDDHYIRGRKK